MHRGTTRRELLKVGFGLSASMPAFVSRMAFAEAGASSKLPDDNILVVVQLSGGNDGLNTVVPLGADPYFKARPNIALKDNLHSLSDEFGLNPGMTAFKQLYEEGHLGVIHGCGYPQPNRSHFRSM
jgi:uncharacterized protein (DUF1501 family)